MAKTKGKGKAPPKKAVAKEPTPEPVVENEEIMEEEDEEGEDESENEHEEEEEDEEEEDEVPPMAAAPAATAKSSSVPEKRKRGRPTTRVVEASMSNGKKKQKKSSIKETYSMYIHRVFKQIHPELGISRRSMDIINSFVNDMFIRLTNEAAMLISYGKKRTLSSREIETACKLALPGELGNHAVFEGKKSLALYMQTMQTKQAEAEKKNKK